MTAATVTPTRRTWRRRLAARWHAMLLRELYNTELHLADMRVRLALAERDS